MAKRKTAPVEDAMSYKAAGETDGATATDAAPQKKPTVMGAVREALKEGIEEPAEIVAFVRERFGLEIDNKKASLNKSLIKKGKKTGKTATPASEGLGDAVKSVKELVERFGGAEVRKLVDLFD